MRCIHLEVVVTMDINIVVAQQHDKSKRRKAHAPLILLKTPKTNTNTNVPELWILLKETAQRVKLRRGSRVLVSKQSKPLETIQNLNTSDRGREQVHQQWSGSRTMHSRLKTCCLPILQRYRRNCVILCVMYVDGPRRNTPQSHSCEQHIPTATLKPSPDTSS